MVMGEIIAKTYVDIQKVVRKTAVYGDFCRVDADFSW